MLRYYMFTSLNHFVLVKLYSFKLVFIRFVTLAYNISFFFFFLWEKNIFMNYFI